MEKTVLKNIAIKLTLLLAITFIGYKVLMQLYKPKADKFSDLVLNNVSVGDEANKDIYDYYGCYFNKNTVDNLLSGSTLANSNYIGNSANIATKLNTLSANIDTLMIQLNNDILNNIGENYARAHLLNKQREEMKKTLDNLPLKNI